MSRFDDISERIIGSAPKATTTGNIAESPSSPFEGIYKKTK
jgi:hypothetical protein